MFDHPMWPRRLLAWTLVATLAWFAAAPFGCTPSAWGQDPPPLDEGIAGPTPFTGEEAAAEPPSNPTPELDLAPELAPSPPPEADDLNVLTLLLSGGYFMIPLGLFSILVVTFSIERALALRRSRVMPPGLVAGLGGLSTAGGFDPRRAYLLCQQYPSAAANVIRAMLLKVGRPHSEVEHTVAEASQREAERLYGNVRWLTMSAAVAPLIGLLGTVWGMIVAFHNTTILAPGQNKANFLAEGIYVALVTTLAGLCVAIPAAILAHYFEGRIQSLFHQIDELMFNLLPQIERYEGRVRFGRPAEGEEPPREPTPPPPQEPRRPAAPAPK